MKIFLAYQGCLTALDQRISNEQTNRTHIPPTPQWHNVVYEKPIRPVLQREQQEIQATERKDSLVVNVVGESSEEARSGDLT